MTRVIANRFLWRILGHAALLERRLAIWPSEQNHTNLPLRLQHFINSR